MSLEALWSGLGIAPQVVSAMALSERRVRLYFDSRMRIDIELLDPENYTINAELGSEARAVVSVIASSAETDPSYVDLELDGVLTDGAENYEAVVATSVADLAGNTLDPEHDRATFDGQHAPPLIGDHCAAAIDRLAAQFRDKPKLEGVICALVDQIQDLEQAATDVLAYRGLDSAVGAQLDELGVKLDHPRDGHEDSEYRLRLKAKALAKSSNGTPEQLIAILRLLDAGFSDARTFTESYPAAEVLTCQVPPGKQAWGVEFAQLLIDAKAVGVKLILEFAEAGVTLFGWDEDDEAGAWEDDPDAEGIWAEAVGSGRLPGRV